MAVIKKALAKRSKYRQIKKGSKMLTYISNCIIAGEAFPMFQNPHIITLFYTAGTTAKTALFDALDVYDLAPSKGKLDIVKAKIALAVIWVDSYADQVEVISNDVANRTTVDEAAGNINNSGLTAQKLGKNSKGKPLKPTLTGKYLSGGKIAVEVTNGTSYAPSMMTFVCVSVPPVSVPPVASALVEMVNGEITVTCAVPVQVKTISIMGKGPKVEFTGINPALDHELHAIAQNSKKLISDLSVVILVKA